MTIVEFYEATHDGEDKVEISWRGLAQLIYEASTLEAGQASDSLLLALYEEHRQKLQNEANARMLLKAPIGDDEGEVA